MSDQKLQPGQYVIPIHPMTETPERWPVVAIDYEECGLTIFDANDWKRYLAGGSCTVDFKKWIYCDPFEYVEASSLDTSTELATAIRERDEARQKADEAKADAAATAFVEEIQRLRVELAFAKYRLDQANEYAAGNYWSWQGDGTDHLESLVCPVSIPASDLRCILDRLEKAEAVVAKLPTDKGGNVLSLGDNVRDEHGDYWWVGSIRAFKGSGYMLTLKNEIEGDFATCDPSSVELIREAAEAAAKDGAQ